MPDFDQTAFRLRTETVGLVNLFRDRAKQVRGSRELLSLLKQLDERAAADAALKFFGEGEHKATGIDGSMATDELLEMIIFYTNASAFDCPFIVDAEGLRFDLRSAERQEKLDVSCTVPLWMEDLPAVIPSRTIDTDFDLNSASAKLPFAAMAMGEIAIANKVVDSGASQIVFMDRPLSGTYGPLARDFRELLRRDEIPMVGWSTPFGKLTKLDLALAYHIHDGSLKAPKRRRFMHCYAAERLLGGDRMSYGSLANELGLSDGDLKAVRREFHRLCGDGAFLEVGDKPEDAEVKMTEEATGYWRRVSYVVEEMQRRMFEGEDHPLKLDDEKWVTGPELNTINLIMLRELCSKSLERRALIIGIAKDTYATEFGRTIIPYSDATSVKSSDKSPWLMKSDKSLLNIFSTSDDLDVRTPWRTAGYDAAFGSLLVTSEKGRKLVAARRRMATEQLFVRSYFELRSLSSDPKSKSCVFLYDRSFWPEFDKGMTRSERVEEERGTITASLYYEGADVNPLDNLVLKILSCSDNPNVLEAFGHNHLLFLADKAVKADAKIAQAMLRGVVWLELGPLAKSDRLFNAARRFRDIRSEAEHARERGASR